MCAVEREIWSGVSRILTCHGDGGTRWVRDQRAKGWVMTLLDIMVSVGVRAVLGCLRSGYFVCLYVFRPILRGDSGYDFIFCVFG